MTTVNGYEIKPGADLEGAYLSGADLSGVSLSGADLMIANLRGADLEGADLRGADLTGASLNLAVLNRADLRGADLRGADLHNAELKDAELKDAKIDLIPGHEELLKKVAEHALAEEDSSEMDKWHYCDTIHCIAGWAIHLHPEGKELEEKYGSENAGLFLLGHEAHSHFFDDNEDATEYLVSVLNRYEISYPSNPMTENKNDDIMAIIQDLENANSVMNRIDTKSDDYERSYPFAIGYSRGSMETTIRRLKKML